MKQNDIRIGNIIKLSNTGSIIKAEEIYKVHPHKDYLIEWSLIEGKEETSKGNSIIDILEPVSLTARLLIMNCGFKRLDNELPEVQLIIGNAFSDASGTYIFQGTGLTDNRQLSVSYKVNGVISAAPILYLHQLQNIYFALTGQELTINYNREFL